MPPAEPTADVVAQTQAFLDNQPAAPAPVAPAQPAPTQVAPQQPAPGEVVQPTAPAAPVDPFTQFAQPAQPTEPVQPAAPTEPVAPVQPTQPTEPTPNQQPSQPVEPSQPATQPPVTPAVPEYQTYDEYMRSVVDSVPAAPELPDHSKIAPDDAEGIKTFFDDFARTIKEQTISEITRKNAIQSTERNLWDAAFEKYGSLKSNKDLRDMVHNIRMGHFQKGIAITPTQAADKLLDAMKANYQRGVADNQVQTTIESVQPTSGGGTNVPTTLDKQNVLTAIQDGGEQALAAYLDGEVKAGRL